MIDVAALHQEHLLLHLGMRDGMTARGIGFVAVHALQLHRLVVDIEIAACQPELIVLGRCLADLHSAHTKVGAGAVEHTALLVLQLCHQHIAVGGLGAPQAGLLHLELGMVAKRGALHHLVECSGGLLYGIGCGIAVQFYGIDGIGHCVVLEVLLAQIAHLGVHGEGGLLAGNGGRAHGQVADFSLRHTGEIGAADDARQSEHVLRLQEGSVAVAIHLHGHHVLALGQEVGDVKACGVAAVLAEAHITAVDP